MVLPLKNGSAGCAYAAVGAPAQQLLGLGATAARLLQHGPGSRFDVAFEGFAGTHQVARWQGNRFSIPPDGWLRRSDNVYEQSVEDDRLLMVDVGQSTDGWTVSGLWVCTPTPSAS